MHEDDRIFVKPFNCLFDNIKVIKDIYEYRCKFIHRPLYKCSIIDHDYRYYITTEFNAIREDRVDKNRKR